MWQRARQLFASVRIPHVLGVLCLIVLGPMVWSRELTLFSAAVCILILWPAIVLLDGALKDFSEGRAFWFESYWGGIGRDGGGWSLSPTLSKLLAALVFLSLLVLMALNTERDEHLPEDRPGSVQASATLPGSPSGDAPEPGADEEISQPPHEPSPDSGGAP